MPLELVYPADLLEGVMKQVKPPVVLTQVRYSTAAWSDYIDCIHYRQCAARLDYSLLSGNYFSAIIWHEDVWIAQFCVQSPRVFRDILRICCRRASSHVCGRARFRRAFH